MALGPSAQPRDALVLGRRHDDPVGTDRLDDPCGHLDLTDGHLEVDVCPGASCDEGEDVVEVVEPHRGGVGVGAFGDDPRTVLVDEAGVVAHHGVTVAGHAHVELDELAAEVDRPLERRHRVLAGGVVPDAPAMCRDEGAHGPRILPDPSSPTIVGPVAL